MPTATIPFHKLYSVWVYALIGALAGLELVLPEVRPYISAQVYAVLSVVGLVARRVKQELPKLPPTTMVLLLSVLFAGCLTGCGSCHVRAEAKAAKRAVEACSKEGAASTDECEAWPAIEAEMKAEQEACP